MTYLLLTQVVEQPLQIIGQGLLKLLIIKQAEVLFPDDLLGLVDKDWVSDHGLDDLAIGGNDRLCESLQLVDHDQEVEFLFSTTALRGGAVLDEL